ncbi:MAG: 1-deoxy-D-xylulose 5-phosphate reductoisomerase [Sulfurovum sp. AS07-7]|nr:MAG: 1-deoxy-D-xylulose 5-phosphate reductoisomerase [Sulfurovum sp. AS07-7]
MVILGSTGSIGVNTLQIASRFNIQIEALVAGDNISLLNEQIRLYKPKIVGIKENAKKHLVEHKNIFCGEEEILDMLGQCKSKTVVNALVGYAGLMPTLRSIELGKKVALANKESLVVAGHLIDISKITPIDSEHFGLWYLAQNKKFNKLYITASGGAFRDWDIDKIKNASLKDALNHPNWSMGDKITIDSATMTNKLFELLEAAWLFDTTNIDAVLEKKSIVHALVEFADGSTTAHFADVDMKLPIAFALLDEVNDEILKPIDLLSIGAIEFLPIDTARYPIWQIKDEILKKPHLGVVINAANEVAIEKYKTGRCSFAGISEIVLDAYKKFDHIKPSGIEDTIKINREVREYVNNFQKLPERKK